ncbi:hypothetical protein EF888_06495 [Silicimonas algicola]|uniref:Uncharacterized protein n=1 Tax=Silicimonas algicola TaxID=1826607 RepID=A0A316G4M4_9RHOB|nr:hypothetical protein [Silicimonas algicola]AZQ66819.1 hypothetical protein EF888_06495 [Silicimonas algicola]PWK55275.1 hypothetical protein C8D95_108154 [Silicimonas algicola]
MFQYEAVKIVGMDADKTRTYDDNDLLGVHLTLTRAPDRQWMEDFNATWHSHSLGLLRSASIKDGGLFIQCLPDELENEYMPRLRKVVSEVDERQRLTAMRAHEAAEAKSKADVKQRSEISELAKRINKT